MSLARKVDLSLWLIFVALLLLFPLNNDSIVFRLLYAALHAALIGGIADTFAVRALFGDPLRIRWPAFMGTRVIARNRARFEDELATLAEHDLLTRERVRTFLHTYSLRSSLYRHVQTLLGEPYARLRPHLALNLLTVSRSLIVDMLNDSSVRYALLSMIQSALHSYTAASTARKLALQAARLTPSSLLDQLLRSLPDTLSLEPWLDNQLELDPERIVDMIELQLVDAIVGMQAMIGSFIRNELRSYKDDEIIALIEQAAGRDLHYIRLNGIFVGAIVGVMFQLIVLGSEQL